MTAHRPALLAALVGVSGSTIAALTAADAPVWAVAIPSIVVIPAAVAMGWLFAKERRG